MNAETEQIEEQELDQDFLAATEHVPGEVHDDKTQDFNEVNAGTVTPAGQVVTGWTVEGVAAVFNGIFTLLVLAKVFVPVGGEHWNIPNEKTLQLGNAFLPIFQAHVPYGSGEENWIPELLMWTGALGAIKMVCGDAIKIEIENFKLERLRAIQQQRATTARNTTASTETETSSESSSTQVSEEAARRARTGESFA